MIRFNVLTIIHKQIIKLINKIHSAHSIIMQCIINEFLFENYAVQSAQKELSKEYDEIMIFVKTPKAINKILQTKMIGVQCDLFTD